VSLSFRASWPRFRQRRISRRLKLARPGIQENQSFWIPAFAGKTDSDSRLVSELWFKDTRHRSENVIYNSFCLSRKEG
jgi:hypothetical protein